MCVCACEGGSIFWVCVFFGWGLFQLEKQSPGFNLFNSYSFLHNLCASLCEV